MDGASRRLRMAILGGGRTFADVAASIGISDRTMRDYVKDPEAFIGVMRDLTRELDLTPADVWTIVTGKELTLRELMAIHV